MFHTVSLIDCAASSKPLESFVQTYTNRGGKIITNKTLRRHKEFFNFWIKDERIESDDIPGTLDLAV
ncbi:MAG: hypothetical protein DWH94_10815 [Planctomycetota bacterium]|nr:MAG: hypothetical protein DWH94_10815 [Planctomycetota bacterium]